MPKISIIIPVYNTEQYLRRCVDSVLAQTFTDFECILIDDGSPDNCPAICDEYAEKDCRIRVIHQENQGQAAARNHAVRRAQSEWICFIDSDDIIHPQMLERLYDAAIESRANLSMCSAAEADDIPDNFFKTFEKLHYTSITLDEQQLLAIYDQGIHRGWVVWAKLIRKNIVQNNIFTEGKIYEDNAVVCRWLIEAGMVSDITDRLYFYRINQQGTTKSPFQLKKLDSLWALCEMINFFDILGYKKLKTRFCSMYMESSIGYYWSVLNELGLREVAENIKRQMHQMMRKNCQYIRLTRSRRLAVYEIFYPKVMRLYWLYQASIQTVKDKGMIGLVKKIFIYMCGGRV